MSKMTLAMAERIAAMAFGPSAQCVRHKDPKNKNRRFAIYFSDKAQGKDGEKGLLSVYLAGSGQDWESALKMSNDNPFAQAKSAQIREKRAELNKRMAEEDKKKGVVPKKQKQGSK